MTFFSGKFLNFVDIGFWNLNGIFRNIGSSRVSKLDDANFTDNVRHLDIFTIAESHIGPNQEGLKIEGFWHFASCRGISANNRYYGGLVLYVKEVLRPGVKIIKSDNPDILWIKLQKSHFGFEKDAYLAFVYIPPENSSYLDRINKDTTMIYSELEDDINEFSKIGDIFLMGDFNAYTNLDSDFVSQEDSDDIDHLPLPSDYICDEPMDRKNLDLRITNDSGVSLLNMCKGSSLRLLNGRVEGDKNGHFTRYPLHSNLENLEPSVIDYGIAHVDSFGMVKSFKVHCLSTLSDHCCISLQINANNFIQRQTSCQNNSLPGYSKLPKRILWDTSLAPTFVSTLGLNVTKEQLLNFVSTEFEPNQVGVDTAVKQLTSIINTAAEMVFPVKSSRFRNKKKRMKKPWFTNECLTLRKRLTRLAAKMKEAPFSRDARERYRATYLDYRTLLRKEERIYTQKIKQQLISMENKDPKAFWDLVSRISKDESKANDSADKGGENFGANLKKYHSYFSELYNKPLNAGERNLGATVFGSSLSENFRASKISEHLNSPFSEEEILSGAAKLKNGKASGFDSVLNECLKHGRHALSRPVQKLFNLIRQSGCYPNDWSFNILSTIYKGGQKDDLDNYRGISVGSCFGKMFGLLLTNRLRNTIAKFGLIGPNQIGFLEENRTSDHVFVVNTLVNKIVKNEGKHFIQLSLI